MCVRPVRWCLSLICVASWVAALSCNAIVDFDGYTFTRERCTQSSECARPADPCMRAECVNGGCSERIAERAACSANGGNVCNAQGQCVGCIENGDCPSGACLDSMCVCDDGIKNGDETGIDCGGSRCGPCSAGTTCAENSDCIGGTCTTDICDMCGDAGWAQWTPGDGEWAIRKTSVRDKRTGLTWAREPASEMKNWEQANLFCQGLALDDGQWRLPTRVELGSIVDYEKDKPPAVDEKAFPNIPPSGFWTATTKADNNEYAWFVSLETGYIDVDETIRELSVLCVR
jgi:hypothetical protein